jgi:hypothetical protein
MPSTTNLPILYRNILDALGSDGSDEVGKAFLWATEMTENDRYLYKAEAFAEEVRMLGRKIWVLIAMGGKHHPAFHFGKHLDLYIFMMRRHAFHSFPKAKDAWI